MFPAGQTTKQVFTLEGPEHAIAHGRAILDTTNDSEAALSPQKDTT